MEQLFRDVKSQKQYSSIILDSSPVLLTSESKGLLQYVDTAILVVRAKKTPAEVVSQAIKILVKRTFLGVCSTASPLLIFRSIIIIMVRSIIVSY